MKENFKKAVKENKWIVYVAAFLLFLAFVGVATYRHELRTDPDVVAIQAFDRKLAEAKQLVTEEVGCELEPGQTLALFKTGDGRYVWRVDDVDILSGERVSVGEEQEFFSQAARAALDEAIQYRSRPAGLGEEIGADVGAHVGAFGAAVGVVLMLAIFIPLAIFLVHQEVWDPKTAAVAQGSIEPAPDFDSKDPDDEDPFSDLD